MQRAAYLAKNRKRHISLPALDSAGVAPVDASLLGELFLRPSQDLSSLADAVSENFKSIDAQSRSIRRTDYASTDYDPHYRSECACVRLRESYGIRLEFVTIFLDAELRAR